MIRRLGLALAVIMLLVPLTVFSAGEKGSIRLRLRHDGVAVPGGNVALYALSDGEDTGDPQTLWKEAESTGQSLAVMAVGPDGEVRFDDLEPGRYLLGQPESAEGFLPIKPFCVSLPMTVDGQPVYHIDAAPKTERKPDSKLPQTGLLIWPAYLLLAVGAAVTGAGILVSKRK